MYYKCNSKCYEWNASFNSFLRYVLSRRSEIFFFIPLISPPGYKPPPPLPVYKPTQNPFWSYISPRALKWDFTVFKQTTNQNFICIDKKVRPAIWKYSVGSVPKHLFSSLFWWCLLRRIFTSDLRKVLPRGLPMRFSTDFCSVTDDSLFWYLSISLVAVSITNCTTLIPCSSFLEIDSFSLIFPSFSNSLAPASFSPSFTPCSFKEAPLAEGLTFLLHSFLFLFFL